VRPWPLTSTGPRPGRVLTATCTGLLTAVLGVVVVATAVDVLDLLLLLPQAAASNAMGAIRIASDLRIKSSLGPGALWDLERFVTWSVFVRT